MLKALIRKDLAQLGSIYFTGKKTGKPLAGPAKVGICLLLGFLFFSFAMMFYGIASSLCAAFVPERTALYFALMGLLTIAFGIIGNVFTTYSILYKAKDNDLLLSMPFPPSRILISRMTVVGLMSLIMCAVTWLPAVIAYAVKVGAFSAGFVNRILLMFLLAALTTVLCCFLGWIVALLTRRIRNKSLATVLFSLVFIGAYYFLYFKMSSVIKAIAANGGAIEQGIRGWGWPMWQLGLAAEGRALPMVVFALIAAALLIIACFILSSTLLRIMTASYAGKKAVYRVKNEKLSGVDSALLRKEFSRFAASPTYILNSGFGILMMLAGAMLAFIYGGTLREGILSTLPPWLTELLPIAVLGVSLLLSSTVMITAPSVSLEGKQIWLIRSMPVQPIRVLRAKERMHLLLGVFPAALLAAALCVVLKLPVLQSALLVLCSGLFVWMTAAFGLMMNLLKPNLNWVSEAVPVKQGLPVLFSMLFGFAAAVACCALCFFISTLTGVTPALAVCAALILGASLLLDNWISRKGTRLFEQL